MFYFEQLEKTLDPINCFNCFTSVAKFPLCKKVPILTGSADVSFKRIPNDGGTWSSVCLRCMRILETSAPLSIVEIAEEEHLCSEDDLQRAKRLERLAGRDLP